MKKSYQESDFYILFVDDEEVIRMGLDKLFQKRFRILTAPSVDEAVDLLNKNKIGIAIVDFDMPEKNGLELLEIIHSEYPNIRRIMLTGNQEIDLVKKAINEGKVHNFVHKPIEKILLDEILDEQAELYLRTEIEHNRQAMDTQDAKTYRQEISNRNKILFNTLIDFENKELNVLGTQIGELITEYFTHMAEILDTQKKNRGIIPSVKFLQLNNILRDCELLVNKFQLIPVQLLVQLIYANIFLLSGDLPAAAQRFDQTIGILERLDESEKEIFRMYMEEFPLFSLDENFVIDNFLDVIYSHISDLLSFDITKLTNLSTKQLMLHDNIPNIGYIIIVKNQLPVYTKTVTPRIKTEPDLITNFVIALTMFAEDVFSSEGSLNVISHDLGVILIHQVDEDLLYVVFASNETIGLRAGLREFAEETSAYVRKSQPHTRIPTSNEVIVASINKYFSQ